MHIGKFKINKNYLFLVIAIVLVILMNKGFSFIASDINMTSNVNVKKYERALYDVIKNKAVEDNVKSTYVESTTGIDFSKKSSSTNGQGVYLRHGTEEDNFPIYYYRGNVTDNNVLFANYCWKIVRTTDTGGIKLLFNGNPDSNGVCKNIDLDTTEIGSSVWYNKYSSPVSNSYTIGSNIKYTEHIKLSLDNLYASDYEYTSYEENGTVKYHYVLKDAKNITSNKDLETYRYSCLNSETTCDELAYIYYSSSEYIYYIKLDNNETPKQLLDKMLLQTEDESNSEIKTNIENWYEQNLNTFKNKLEDTIWCNDRGIADYGSWTLEKTNGFIYFESTNRISLLKGSFSLDCSNKDYSYTANETEKGNGALEYPIGLLTVDEVWLAGITTEEENNENYLNNTKTWWTMTPSFFGYQSALLYEVENSNKLSGNGYTNHTHSVRPSVSLKNSSIITSGDGTADDPYVVSEN